MTTITHTPIRVARLLATLVAVLALSAASASVATADSGSVSPPTRAYGMVSGVYQYCSLSSTAHVELQYKSGFFWNDIVKKNVTPFGCITRSLSATCPRGTTRRWRMYIHYVLPGVSSLTVKTSAERTYAC